MNLQNLNLKELNSQEAQETEGGSTLVNPAVQEVLFYCCLLGNTIADSIVGDNPDIDASQDVSQGTAC